MRNPLHLLPDAATAAIHAGSIGVAAGVVGCAVAGNLASGARAALVGFLSAGALFGYRLYRIHHPRRAFLDAPYLRGGPAAEAHVEIKS
ncbi:MAG: hypothetical protein F9K29_07325 [Hyphomicrobiaceae bacterium]|nr:MAG: hypothetical protein F9K29_07325 [Hyphomicrobiaceae bacterium]